MLRSRARPPEHRLPRPTGLLSFDDVIAGSEAQPRGEKNDWNTPDQKCMRPRPPSAFVPSGTRSRIASNRLS